MSPRPLENQSADRIVLAIRRTRSSLQLLHPVSAFGSGSHHYTVPVVGHRLTGLKPGQAVIFLQNRHYNLLVLGTN